MISFFLKPFNFLFNSSNTITETRNKNIEELEKEYVIHPLNDIKEHTNIMLLKDIPFAYTQQIIDSQIEKEEPEKEEPEKEEPEPEKEEPEKEEPEKEEPEKREREEEDLKEEPKNVAKSSTFILDNSFIIDEPKKISINKKYGSQNNRNKKSRNKKGRNKKGRNKKTQNHISKIQEKKIKKHNYNLRKRNNQKLQEL